MRILLAVLAVAIAAIATPPSPDSGLKIVTVQDQPEGPSARTTEYISRDRRRTEFRYIEGSRTSPSGPTTFNDGPQSALIIRCDLSQQFYVNLDAREYITTPQPSGFAMVAPVALMSRLPAAPPATGPTISIEVTTTDTGERKQVFGHVARHVITVRKQTPSEPAAGSSAEMTTDGWYIDLDARTQCEPMIGSAHLFASVHTGGIHTERPRVLFTESGAPERGFPIEIAYTYSDRRVRSLSKKVTELTTGPLDPALFDVPPGFYHTNRWDRVMMMRAVQMWQQFPMQAWQQLQVHARHVFGWDR